MDNQDSRKLLFDIRRSIRYHNRRRSFFDRFDSMSNVLSLLLGSAVVTSLLQESTLMATICGLMVTCFSSLNLIIGSSKKARLHHDLARRFIDFEKKTSSAKRKADVEALTEERLTIEADEPPVLRVLDCLCHNEELRAQGYEKEQEAKITLLQRFFAQLFDFCPSSIRTN